MLKVGLTGNYCTGLEGIANIFRRYKVPLFDADLVVKYMLYNSTKHIEKIRKEFGDSVFTNNILDVSKFEGMDNESGFPKFYHLMKLLDLDLITYYERFRLEHGSRANRDSKYSKFTIFKSQILFEYGFNVHMNTIINVYKPDGMRMSELQTHLGMKAGDVFDLLGTEMDQLIKNNHSTYVVHNYDTYHESDERQIAQIYKSISKKIEREEQELIL
jgi:dephospho-CoA kinase